MEQGENNSSENETKYKEDEMNCEIMEHTS